MVRITEQLVRRRAEHNELEISTLEEVSLHQQDIEKIEFLDKWCRELKILYLQSNLIEKIENVSRLKKLEYLNLALNNVEKIENLENCESLEKLDLTVNFVGELTSVENLKGLEFFRDLYLTGNPCTDFEGYKEYVIATLPRLDRLDGIEIEKSERITAIQNYESVKKSIIRQEKEYLEKRRKEQEAEERKKQKTSEKKPGFDGRWYTDINSDPKSGDTTPKPVEEEETIAPGDERDKAFWDEAVPYTPESRKEVHAHMQKLREHDEKKPDPKQEKKTRRYFADDGRAMNVNEAKIDFKFDDDEKTGCYMLDIAVFKHMDTSLMDADVHPHYVRVTLKDKIFQLCLDQEVIADKSTAQRSQTTGHLVIKMPKLNPQTIHYEQLKPATKTTTEKSNKTQLLEVDPTKHSNPDFGNIYTDKKKEKVEPLFVRKEASKPRENSENFVDDPDVPPLI